MRSSLKKILLLVTLVVPVLTYLFLRSFGDNRYELPVYYQEEGSVESCVDLLFPHTIDLGQLTPQPAAASVFYFPATVTSNKLYQQLSRIIATLSDVGVYGLISEPAEVTIGTGLLIPSNTDFLEIVNCQLLMGEGSGLSEPPKNKLVLVDKFGRIRGYYDGAEFDDMDRLELELKILFAEYNY
jgi:protein SCO1/2